MTLHSPDDDTDQLAHRAEIASDCDVSKASEKHLPPAERRGRYRAHDVAAKNREPQTALTEKEMAGTTEVYAIVPDERPCCSLMLCALIGFLGGASVAFIACDGPWLVAEFFVSTFNR